MDCWRLTVGRHGNNSSESSDSWLLGGCRLVGGLPSHLGGGMLGCLGPCHGARTRGRAASRSGLADSRTSCLFFFISCTRK